MPIVTSRAALVVSRRSSAVRVVALAAALLALTACAGTGASPGSATPRQVAQDALPACTVAAGAAGATDISTWREVTGPGFRFCVPPTWYTAQPRDTTGAAAGRWRHSDRGIEWSVGPFRPSPAQMSPYNERTQRDLWLGTRAGQLYITSIEDRNWFAARFAATADMPEVRFAGSATGAAARAEVDAVFRTLRGPATP